MALKLKPPTWALAKGSLDVIGMARFSTLSNTAVTGLQKYGVISNVKFRATSTFDVQLLPAQKFYTVAGMASSDATSVSFVSIVSSPVLTTNGFTAQVIGVSPLGGRNSGCITITIFGRRQPLNYEAVKSIPKPHMGLIGMATFSVTPANTVANLIMTGCISGITATGNANSVKVSMWPSQQFYTVSAMFSDDGVNPTFAHVQPFTGAGYFAGNGFNLQPVGVNPIVGRTSNFGLVMIYGFVGGQS